MKLFSTEGRKAGQGIGLKGSAEIQTGQRCSVGETSKRKTLREGRDENAQNEKQKEKRLQVRRCLAWRARGAHWRGPGRRPLELHYGEYRHKGTYNLGW